MKKMYLFALLALSTLSFGQDLISDGGFETQTSISGATTPWFSGAGGISITTLNPRSGTKALLWGTTFRTLNQAFTAVPGTTYIGTYYVRYNQTTMTGDSNVYVSITDGSITTLVPPIVGMIASFSSSANGYLKYTFTFTAPQANLTLAMSKGTSNATINLDDISIVPGALTTLTAAPPYSFPFTAATPQAPTFTATPAVTITYSHRGTTYNSVTAPTNAGIYSAVGSIANGLGRDYLVVPFMITGTPTISTVPTSSLITPGQTLASSSLTGGVASVAGTFAFTTPSTIPSTGVTTQGYTFTPTDTTNFTNVSGTVSVTSASLVAGWDVSTLPGGVGLWGTSPYAATTSDSNVTVVGFTRGAGFTTSATGAARGWGGTSGTVANLTAAITASQFITFSVKPVSGSTMSLSSINPFSYRRSGTGPSAGALQYSTDGTTFIDITTSISFSSTLTTGASIASINLGGISALQNIPSSTTITFRLVPHTSTGGTFYIYDTAVSTASDFSIQGNVCVTPAAPTASNLTVAFDGAAKSVTATVAAANTVDWYSVSSGGSPVLSSSLTSPANTNAGTYTYYAEARNTASGCSLVSATRTSVVITILSQTTWNGSAWIGGTPTSTTDAVIDGTYSTSSNLPISAKSLTVNATTGNLTINTGTNVTVAAVLINNGTITVENNANLIQTAVANTNSGSGTAIVNRNSAALKRLDFTIWSSPVSGEQKLEEFSPNTSRIPNRFYTYDSPNNVYANVATASNFTPGRGYLIRMPHTADALIAAPYAGQFTGTSFNNGTVTLSGLTANQFYLVGNPYPSTLDAAEFLVDNPGTLYFWRKTNGAPGTAYATYNTVGPVAAGSGVDGSGSAAPNGTIQVGQGFIAKTGSLATTLVFKNSMRNGTVSTQFFKTKKVTEKSRVWLNLTNAGGVFSQTLVGYLDGATLGVDTDFDGKYINDSAIALTSIVDGGEYTIQGRPAFDATDVVALGFKTDMAGDYTIALNSFDGLFDAGQDVYLVDVVTGNETDLKTGSYNFTATAGVHNARFSLKYQKTLKVDAPAFNDNSVKVYKNNGRIVVNSTAKTIKTIAVYDVQGRLIAKQMNVNASTATINNLKDIRQMLIVKVSADDNSVVSKKVLN